MVCWDNRLPHATCDKLESYDTREVVYTGWLPNVKLNFNYWLEQAESIKKNIIPPAFAQKDSNGKIILEKVDKNWELNDLSLLQKKLLFKI